MSCSKFLGSLATLVVLSPLSFAQTNSQDKTLDEIKQSLSELRKENADLKARLSTLETKPADRASSMSFDREIAELSSRFAKTSDVMDKGAADHKGTPLTMTGDLRVRGEWRNQPTGPDTLRFLERLRINLDWMVSDHINVFAQLKDSRKFGDTFTNETADTAGIDTTGESSPSFHQVYVAMKDFMGTGTNMKIGRQEMALGSERLVGDNDFNNVGRSFEGFRADGNWDDVSYSMFFMSVLNSPYTPAYNDQRLYGLWLTLPLFGEQMKLDAYAMLFADDTAADNHLQTYGGRMWGKIEIVDYSFEAATQQNEPKDAVGVDFHDTYFFHGDLGISIDDLDGKPHLSFVYDMATEQFNFLFPDNHARFGQSDIIASGTDLVHTAILLNMDIYDGWRFGAEYHANRKWQGAGSSNDLGKEIDLTLKGKCGDHIWMTIAGGHNFGGDGLAARGAGSGGEWFTPAAGDKTTRSDFAYVGFTVPF